MRVSQGRSPHLDVAKFADSASELVGCLVVLPLKHTKTKVAGEFIWKTKRSTCFVWVSSCKWVPLVTRIVGEMWPVQSHCEGLPMYEEAQQVHHVDGDRANNSFGQPGAMYAKPKLAPLIFQSVEA